MPSLSLNPAALFDRMRGGRLPSFLRRQESFLALDIGSSSVKLAAVSHGPHGPRLSALGMHALPASVIQSNVIQDALAVAEAIRELVQRTGVQARAVLTAVPGPAVIVKKVILPAQAAASMETAVYAEAAQLVPDSLDNVNLDYQVIDALEDGDKVEILVVAVKREIINSYTDTIRAAGLEPVLVDVDYFALENAYELNYDPPDDGSPVALVNIGARYSSINILKNGRSTFTGDVPVGAAEFTDALVRQLGVTPEVAAELQRGKLAGGIAADASAAVVAPVTEFIVEEIQRAIGFFWTAATDEPLGAVMLSGGPARMPGLTAQLADRLGCTVEVVDPFRRLAMDSRIDRQLVEECGPALAVTVGLATRRPGDK